MDALFAGLDPKVIGTHKFSFRAALRCREAGLSEEQAELFIEQQESYMPRAFRAGEVAEAVGNAYDSQATKHSAPKWPAANKARQQSIISAASHVTIAALQQSSPEPLDQHPASILAKLFRRDPLVCVSRELDSGTYTRRLSSLTHPSGRWFLGDASFVVPSAMRAEWGVTKAGKESVRCLDNTGPRQHIVVEIDDKSISKDSQVKLLNHLAGYAPLVMVVDSSGKSLHGWFACIGASAESIKKFFVEACAFGADPAAWNKCQLVRMPNGTRRKWKDETRPAQRQQLIYFNPSNRRPVAPLLQP